MNIATAKQQIKDTVEAYLRKDDAGMYVIAPVHQRPVFLLGAPGIGKTAIMEQVARELEIGIVSYSMTHHTRQSALGLPRIEHRVFDGEEFDVSEYTMSEIISAIYDYMERTGLRNGILFLDEINCVSETLYPSMLQFLQFKTFGKHRVPEGWVIVCAGNPPEYNRSVHEFDIVTLDRLREIDVEPDYSAWKSYASAKGLHPAVTTFLETKRDCFYKVESKPGGGKAFVTARGWEDMARIIALYEEMEKPVNRDLVVQFLRDDEIADKFAVYYELFKKYRSDYQVDTILAGEASSSIVLRAKSAEFDERIALISLMLDVLARSCSDVLDLEGVMLDVRDVLRVAKGELLGGALLEDVLPPRIAEREAILARRLESGIAGASYVRKERLVLTQLKEFAAACAMAQVDGGEEAFRVIELAYKTEVAKIKPAASEASKRMDHAFDFVDECFSSREMLVFMAELATRQSTTQFIAHYGNEKYYAHNQDLQVDAARMGLADRASMLDDLNENIKQADNDLDMGSAVGLSLTTPTGSTSAKSMIGVAAPKEKAPIAAAPAAEAVSEAAPAPAESAPEEEPASDEPQTMEEYYQGKQFEYGFSSMCKMVLPAEQLKAKKVLDVCCRRGKGVYKLSSMVGEAGSVIGVDWSPLYIASAKGGMIHAWQKNRLPKNNMEFRVAYPEDLIAAGIGTQSMGAVYINNVFTLLYDPQAALHEFARVLKPGGLLVLETVYADVPRNKEFIEAARKMGNSIQAAPTWGEIVTQLSEAGFEDPEVVEEYDVAACRGAKESDVVETVPGDSANYTAVTIYVRKKK